MSDDHIFLRELEAVIKRGAAVLNPHVRFHHQYEGDFCAHDRHVWPCPTEIRRIVELTDRIRPGVVYYYKEKPYWVLTVARMHHDDHTMVVYVPLYINPAWPTAGPGSERASIRTIEDFAENFNEWWEVATRNPPRRGDA